MFSLAACPGKSPRAELKKLNEINLLPCPAQVATRPRTRLPGQLVNINDTSTAAEFILGTGFSLLSFVAGFPSLSLGKMGITTSKQVTKMERNPACKFTL